MVFVVHVEPVYSLATTASCDDFSYKWKDDVL